MPAAARRATRGDGGVAGRLAQEVHVVTDQHLGLWCDYSKDEASFVPLGVLHFAGLSNYSG